MGVLSGPKLFHQGAVVSILVWQLGLGQGGGEENGMTWAKNARGIFCSGSAEKI
jgi:hypothetical protein